jgi:hypothetical protein
MSETGNSVAHTPLVVVAATAIVGVKLLKLTDKGLARFYEGRRKRRIRKYPIVDMTDSKSVKVKN